MRQYNKTEETERYMFAQKAAKHFEKNPVDITFSVRGPEKGEFFALRWGNENDCVVVFRIHEFDDIVNYTQFIDRAKAHISIQACDAGKVFLEDFGLN